MFSTRDVEKSRFNMQSFAFPGTSRRAARGANYFRNFQQLAFHSYSHRDLGLLGLIRTDTVSAYQRIRLFVLANSMKIVDSDTYQEIPDTGHF